MLALREVTARVLVILCGSFMSQIERLACFSESQAIYRPHCLELGFNTNYSMPAVISSFSPSLAQETFNLCIGILLIMT